MPEAGPLLVVGLY